MFKIDYPFKNEILACGVDEQANFCLTKKNCAYLINGSGSLNEQTVFEHYQREIERLKKELKIKPKIITCDLYPQSSSAKFAQNLSQKMKGVTYLPVQHHRAHLATCIGENRVEGEVIGVVFDNSGFGEDGNIWGGEFFVGNLQDFRRVAHFKYTPVAPNSLYSSSAGRLFDAVSTMVGLSRKTDFQGQGVINLEKIVNRSSHVASKSYEFVLKREKGKFLIHPEPIFQGIVQDLKKNISRSIISAAFHNTIVEIVRQLCHKLRQKEKVKDVILTGSIFQNKLLFNRIKDCLSLDGFTVITHKHFSCNDNNISFGQAVLADARCSDDCSAIVRG